MSNTVSFTYGISRLNIDFDNKQVSLLRFPTTKSSDFEKSLPSFFFNFSDITDIEMAHTLLKRPPSCCFIINGNRIINEKMPNTYLCSIVVSKDDDKELTDAMERIVAECNLGSVKRLGSAPAQKVDYRSLSIDDGSSFKMTKSEVAPEGANEYRKRCNVCGKVFCYTQKDIDDSAKNARAGALSAVGTIANALGGTMYGAVEMNKMTDRQMSKVRDFTKCPYCNSSDLRDITEEEFNQSNNSNNAPQTAASAADEIKKFKELLDMGVITQEEFDAKKKQLLGL